MGADIVREFVTFIAVFGGIWAAVQVLEFFANRPER